MARVLADERAHELIAQLRTQVSEGLATQIEALITTGTELSQPDIWDGPRAEEFRTLWAENVSPALTTAKTQLDELGSRIAGITQAIADAGGGRG
jgi:hypothetical protein